MLEKKSKFGIGPKVLTSLGIPQSDIGGFIYRLGDSAVVDCLLTFLANDQNEWDMIEFHEWKI